MSKAATILAYKRYTDIFPVNPVEAKTLLRKLQKEWHPDKNHDSEAHNVFIHIMQLYELGPSNIKYLVLLLLRPSTVLVFPVVLAVWLGFKGRSGLDYVKRKFRF